MKDYIEDIVNKLFAIINKTDIDWDAFDNVLNSIDDINAYDEEGKKTILSLLLYESYYLKRSPATDIVRRFMEHGYDVTANNGINGGEALMALGSIGVTGHDIMRAAKMLMNAGASVAFREQADDIDEEPESVIEFLKYSRFMGIDYARYGYVINTYYEMAKANIEGKDHNSIEYYLTCIGKTLTSVSIVNNKNGQALKNDRSVTVYTEPLILWFDDKPLVIDRHSRLVVNPVYVEDNNEQLEDISSIFDALVGASLKEVRYINRICYLDFDNGKRLFVVSHLSDHYDERVGAFDIVESESNTDIEKLDVKHVYAYNGTWHYPDVTIYLEDFLILACDNGSYILKDSPVKDISGFEIVPINKDLLDDYAREYPIKSPSKPKCMYSDGSLYAICLGSNGRYLYITPSNKCLYSQLSDKLYDRLEYDHSTNCYFSQEEGIHIDFRKNKDGIFKIDSDFLNYVEDGKVLETFVSEDGFWKVKDHPYDLEFWDSLKPISEEEMLSITNGARPKALDNKV